MLRIAGLEGRAFPLIGRPASAHQLARYGMDLCPTPTTFACAILWVPLRIFFEKNVSFPDKFLYFKHVVGSLKFAQNFRITLAETNFLIMQVAMVFFRWAHKEWKLLCFYIKTSAIMKAVGSMFPNIAAFATNYVDDRILTQLYFKIVQNLCYRRM